MYLWIGIVAWVAAVVLIFIIALVIDRMRCDLKEIKAWKKECDKWNAETDAENKITEDYNRECDKITALVQAQLQCSAKTKGKHKMVYEKKRELDMSPCALNYSSIVTHPYIFKCSICNLEITKTNKELAKAEREHLTGLGVSKKGK